MYTMINIISTTVCYIWKLRDYILRIFIIKFFLVSLILYLYETMMFTKLTGITISWLYVNESLCYIHLNSAIYQLYLNKTEEKSWMFVSTTQDHCNKYEVWTNIIEQ